MNKYKKLLLTALVAGVTLSGASSAFAGQIGDRFRRMEAEQERIAKDLDAANVLRKKQEAAFRQKLADKDAKVKQLNKDLKFKTTEAAKLTTDLAAKELVRADLDRRVKEEEVKVKQLNKDLKFKTTEAANLTTDLAAKELALIELDRRVKEEEVKVTKLTGDLDSKSKEAAKLTTDLATKELARIELDRRVKEEEVKVTKLTGDLDSKSKEAAKLTTDLAAKEGHNARLIYEIAKAGSTETKLKQDLKQLDNAGSLCEDNLNNQNQISQKNYESVEQCESRLALLEAFEAAEVCGIEQSPIEVLGRSPVFQKLVADYCEKNGYECIDIAISDLLAVMLMDDAKLDSAVTSQVDVFTQPITLTNSTKLAYSPSLPVEAKVHATMILDAIFKGNSLDSNFVASLSK